MKVRDSGMPAEEMWASFFNVNLILDELQINSDIYDLAEVGCGYRTFTIPASKQIKGKLYALDIEKEILDALTPKLKTEHIDNVIPEHRDILINTTGLPENSVDYIMLFNILHHESPGDLFNEAYRILRTKGKVGILHWRIDIPTPRGPDLCIRPKPEQILRTVDRQNFSIYKAQPL